MSRPRFAARIGPIQRWRALHVAVAVVACEALSACAGGAAAETPTAPPSVAVDVGPGFRVELEAWTAEDVAMWRGRPRDDEPALRSQPTQAPFVTAVLTFTDRPPPTRICPRDRPARDPLTMPENWTFALEGPAVRVPARATLLAIDEIPGPAATRNVRLVFAVTVDDERARAIPRDDRKLYMRAARDACRRRHALGRGLAVHLPLPQDLGDIQSRRPSGPEPAAP